MNASVFRNTKHELRHVVQQANHFTVQCSPREQTPDVVIVNGTPRLQAKRGPELDLHESLFTDNEMRTIHRALEILEKAYELAYADHEAHPERTVEAIEALRKAKEDREQVELETAEKLQRLQALDEELKKREAALTTPQESADVP